MNEYMKLYYFMPVTYLFDVLTNDEIKVSLPEYCNDPLEFLAAGQSTLTKHGAFISFSRCCDSSLMWAHYADSHRGVCLEFTFKVLKKLGEFGVSKPYTEACVIEADYKEQFTSVPTLENDQYEAQLIQVLYRQDRPEYSPIKKEALQTSVKVWRCDVAAEYYTKSDEWKYEREWRLMVEPCRAKSFHDGAFFVQGLTKYLTSVILGVKFEMLDETAKAMVVQCLKKNPHFMGDEVNVPTVKRAKFSDGKYKILL